jgi:hypothetical protein
LLFRKIIVKNMKLKYKINFINLSNENISYEDLVEISTIEEREWYSEILVIRNKTNKSIGNLPAYGVYKESLFGIPYRITIIYSAKNINIFVRTDYSSLQKTYL